MADKPDKNRFAHIFGGKPEPDAPSEPAEAEDDVGP